jgi:hypothetical protein
MLSFLHRCVVRVPFGEPPVGTDVLWRATTQRYSVIIDAEAERYGTSDAEIQLFWFPIHHRTASGAWIEDMRLPSDSVIRHDDSPRKFVNLKCVKQYASETKLEALKQLFFRRKRQISIYSTRLSRAQEELKNVERAIEQMQSQAQ